MSTLKPCSAVRCLSLFRYTVVCFGILTWFLYPVLFTEERERDIYTYIYLPAIKRNVISLLSLGIIKKNNSSLNYCPFADSTR